MFRNIFITISLIASMVPSMAQTAVTLEACRNDALEYNSISYLLKPIRQQALLKTFEKIEHAKTLLNMGHQAPLMNNNIKQLAHAITKSLPQYRQRIVINKADGYMQVPVDEVAYFSVEEKVTLATTFKQKEHIIDRTLEKLEEELNPQKFFRVNRQFIVNIDAINRIEYYFGSKLILKVNAPLKPSTKIVISRTKAPLVKMWLNQ
jgi:DNA-binding LytR/AlgR family response regulator